MPAPVAGPASAAAFAAEVLKLPSPRGLPVAASEATQPVNRRGTLAAPGYTNTTGGLVASLRASGVREPLRAVGSAASTGAFAWLLKAASAPDGVTCFLATLSVLYTGRALRLGVRAGIDAVKKRGKMKSRRRLGLSRAQLAARLLQRRERAFGQTFQHNCDDFFSRTASVLTNLERCVSELARTVSASQQHQLCCNSAPCTPMGSQAGYAPSTPESRKELGNGHSPQHALVRGTPSFGMGASAGASGAAAATAGAAGGGQGQLMLPVPPWLKPAGREEGEADLVNFGDGSVIALGDREPPEERPVQPQPDAVAATAGRETPSLAGLGCTAASSPAPASAFGRTFAAFSTPPKQRKRKRSSMEKDEVEAAESDLEEAGEEAGQSKKRARAVIVLAPGAKPEEAATEEEEEEEEEAAEEEEEEEEEQGEDEEDEEEAEEEEREPQQKEADEDDDEDMVLVGIRSEKREL